MSHFRFSVVAITLVTSLLAIPDVSYGASTIHALTSPRVTVSSYSEMGDLIDGGVSHIFASEWAHVIATTSGVTLARSGTSSVSFTFDPVAGQNLANGEYDHLERAPFAPAGFAGLNITGPGETAGCSRVTGSFHIWDIAATPNGVLSRLDLTYVEHCDGTPPTNFGEVMINDNPHVGTLSASASRFTFPDQTPQLPYLLTNSSAIPEPVTLRPSTAVVTHFWLTPTVGTCAAVVPAHASCLYTLRLLPPRPGSYAGTILVSAGGSTLRLSLKGTAP